MANQTPFEKNIGLMGMLIVVVVSFGGLAEIVPLMFQDDVSAPVEGIKPLDALALEGRDIYIRDGCHVCHTQMVRPLRAETERYGHYSVAGESVYEHPFLWGSKRTGPDLHRVGGKYPDAWHYNHMENPRSTSPGSIMPNYTWLLSQKLDTTVVGDRLRALRKVGVPYTDEQIHNAPKSIASQSKTVVTNLAVGSITNAPPDREIIAVIAYLQRLGTDIKGAASTTTNAVATAQVNH